MKILLLSIFNMLAIIAYGQLRIPEQALCYPVLFETESNIGSGVFLADSANVFFVTARHNLFSGEFEFLHKIGKFIFYPHDVVNDEQAEIEIDLTTAYEEKYIKYDKSQDIAVILIAHISKIDSLDFIDYYKSIKKNRKTNVNIIYKDNTSTYSETSIGSDIYMFGYPSSIGSKKHPQFDYSRPLLRKGIIAGKYAKNKTIIIDSPSYFGNSGGPVFSIEKETNGLYLSLIGIVSEYIPYIDRWVNKNTEIENIQTSNSGYSIVISIEYALKLIKSFNIESNYNN
jgi:Trypsin-like peptidase domain